MNTIEARDKFSAYRGKSFRQGQEEAILISYESGSKFPVLVAPTGSGKSLVGMTSGEMIRGVGERFLYLCSSKPLQNQLAHDFPECEMMKGRNNYPCAMMPGMNAGDCVHTKTNPCEHKKECEYDIQKQIVLASPRQILNFYYFMIESNYVGKFTNYPIIICDEADTLESIISSTVSLSFNVAQMKRLRVPPPEYSSFNAKGSDEAWKKWCSAAVSAVRGYRSEYRSSSKENTNNAVDYIKYVKELQRLDELESRIIRFAKSYDETWIVEKKKKNNVVIAWNMKPVWLTKEITEKYFFKHGKKFLMMSATLPEQHVMAGLLGLEPGDLDIHEMPSLFPVKNRQIYLHPVANMNTSLNPDENERNIQAMVNKVKQLLHEHRDEKGIIHTVSWMLNKRIMEIGDPRLITHDPEDKSEKLRWHYHSKNPTVFVSPSSMRGVDMIGDRARFNIIIKAPWPNLNDKLVSTRLFGNKGMGKLWYSNMTAMNIIQAAGRSCRSETDWAKTYILDQSAVNLLQKSRYLFPKYILEALTW